MYVLVIVMSFIQVVIATPARLQDILENHGTFFIYHSCHFLSSTYQIVPLFLASSLNLSYIKTLVLDEVDSLLQMGFHKQVCLSVSLQCSAHVTMAINILDYFHY